MVKKIIRKTITRQSGEDVFRHHPKIGWRKIVLLLPVLLSGAWISYLKFRAFLPYGEEFLAPPNTSPLIAALAIFTIGYIIFLLLMFSENIREFFVGKSRRQKARRHPPL